MIDSKNTLQTGFRRNEFKKASTAKKRAAAPGRGRILALSIATLLTMGGFANAASLTWDSDANFANGVTGGSGTWDLTGLNWNNGQADVAWPNSSNDLAIFGDALTGGAAPATVTLGAGITAGGLIFNTSSTVSAYTIAGGTLNLAGAAPTITVNAGATPTISSVLTGSTGLVKAGGGALTLTGASTFSGGTTVNGGTLILSGNSGTGRIRGGLTINAGATVQTVTADALGYNAGQQVDTVTINGGTYTNAVNGNNGFRTSFVLNGGTINESIATTGTAGINFQASEGFGISSLASSTTSTIAARLSIRSGELAFNVAKGTTPSGIDLNVTSVIFANGGTGIVKNGAGTMAIGATTTYTGTTTVNAGTLDLTAGGGATGVIRGTAVVNDGATLRLSTSDALGYSTKVSFLNIVGGTVQVNTVANQTFATMAINMTGGTISGIAGAHIDLFGNGTTLTTNPAALPAVISVPTLGLRQNDTIFDVADGEAAADLLVNSVLINNSGANNQGNHNLIKNGAGTLQLNAANTYTGTTTINAGKLFLGPSASLASPSLTFAGGSVFDVSAQPGATFTLPAGGSLSAGNTSGTGSDVIGSLASSGTLGISGTGVAATLTIAGNLTLSGGAVNFDLAGVTTAGGGVNDLARVVNLNLSGTTNVVINKISGALASSGTYTLFNYSGSLTGNASNLALSGAAGGTTRQTFAIDTASTAGKVLLTVAGSSANLTWTGAASNAWDINTTTNWTGAADANNKFFDGDAVTFNDSGLNTTAVTLGGTVRPSAITLNNSLKDYTFAGTGGIAGLTGLTKSGTGALTIATLNSFTGPVVINAGTVNVATLANAGTASGLGAGTSIALGGATNAATLRYSGPTTATNRVLTTGEAGATIEVTDPAATLTQSGGLTSTGPFTKTGPGGLTISGAFDGPTAVNVNAGSMTVGGIISGFGAVTVGGGALTLNALNTFSGGTTVNNAGVLNLGAGGPAGAIRGTLTINPGGVVNATAGNALGYAAGTRIETLNVIGGLLNTTAAGDQGWGINIFLTGGTLQSNGGVSNAASTQLFSLGGGSSVNSLASATTSVISGRLNLRETNPNDQLPINVEDGPASVDLSISAAITGNAVTRGLVKTGPGVLLLGGVNTYTGTTNINGGTVALAAGATLASNLTAIGAGSTFNVSALGTGFAVASGKTLSISPGGLVIGSVSVDPGATFNGGSTAGNDITGDLVAGGVINVAGTGVAGTLTVGGGLILNGGTLSLDLADVPTAGAATNDLVAVAGNLNLAAPSTLAINPLNGALGTGSYTLLTYGGTLTGNAGSLALSGVATVGRQTYALSTATAGKLLLNVAGNAANLVWAGNGTTNVWDTTTPNFKNGATADKFFSLDKVLFNDTGSATPAVNISVDVQPGSLTVNAAKDYTFSGTGGIIGATGLFKAGTGTLTIANTNSFGGPVAITQGTVSVAAVANIGVPSPLGAGTGIALGDALNGGRLRFTAPAATAATNRPLSVDIGGGAIEINDAATTLTASGAIATEGVLSKAGPGALTVTGVISGAGSVAVNAGTLTLSAMNTYTGETVVNAGTLALTFGDIAGSIRGTLTINAGGTVIDSAHDALGYGPNRATTININGGTYSHTSADNVSIWGMTVNMTGGLFQATNALGRLDFGNDANTGGVPTLINTLPSAATATIAGTNVTLRQPDTLFTVADGAAAVDLLISAPVAGAGMGISKAGAGTMRLTGVNTYTGATNVNEGVLLVAGSISGSAVNVAADATLGGAGGTVGSVLVADGGIVAPGNGVGTLNTGAFSLNSTSVLKFELGVPGVAGGTANDLLNVVGDLTLDGTLKVTSLAGFGAGKYQLFSYTGALLDNTLTLDPAFLTARPGAFIDTATAGVVSLVVVPEPGCALLLGIGLTSLLGLRRRRRA